MAEELREKVLQAAIDEFADFGLSGARVDRIAQRAGANKQLIYYYFGDKDGLFDEAIKSMMVYMRSVRPVFQIPLADRPAAYFKAFSTGTQFQRMLQWEALNIGEGAAVDETERAEFARSGVALLREEQRAGKIPSDLDVAQLFLSFQALAAHPFAFPQMTRFITGRNASDPVFQRERIKFLKTLGSRIFS